MGEKDNKRCLGSCFDTRGTRCYHSPTQKKERNSLKKDLVDDIGCAMGMHSYSVITYEWLFGNSLGGPTKRAGSRREHIAFFLLYVKSPREGGTTGRCSQKMAFFLPR